MLVAKIYVSRTDIKAEKVTPVTAGMVGAEVDVYFGREWDGYAKTYVWEHGGVTKDDTTCSGTIPPEVVARSGGSLKFGVFGTKDGKATPTLWCTVDVVKPGADPSGDETTDPTLPVWAQLREEIEKLKQESGGTITDEQIAAALEKYLAENPIEGISEEEVRRIIADYLEENPVQDGKPGEDGGYYTPDVTQPTDDTMQVAFTPSKAGMPAVQPATVKLPVGSGSGSSPNVNLTEPAEDDIPKVFFGGALQQTKDEAVVPFRYISKTQDFSGYAEIKAQGNSSMNYPKKNQTVKLFKDAECTEKLKVDFKGWGKQNKHVYKANWIDLSHARNVVSARLWGDVVKSRTNYTELPELLRTTPNHGAVDGFPVKVYAAGVYQGRYTLNIPKDKWMSNMDDELDTHCILCGEGYTSGCFREATTAQWTDEIHDTMPASIKNRWVEIINFVMNSTDEEFKNNIGNYFFVDSLIDYHLYGLISCGLDAYGKNQLYMTYDGQRWIASMYDMDSTWGLYWNGSKFVATDYERTSYEDMVSGRQGNLLFIRLEKLFWAELQTRWAELKNGALSIVNVINRFERFTDIAPAELVKEDYASTTGGGKFTGIPSQTTNNIQQIRAFALARQVWMDEYVAGLTPEEAVPCTGITLSASELTFTEVGTQTLVASVEPENTTDTVVWSSDNTSVATVSGGVVTAKGNGTCAITATCGEQSATCAVSVSGIAEPIPCTGITLDKTELSFTEEGSQIIIATVTPVDTTDTISWNVEPSGVVTVSDGTVTAVSNGTATVTATCGNYSTTCTVNVEMPEPSEIPEGANVLAENYEPNGEAFTLYNGPFDLNTQKIVAKIDIGGCTSNNEIILSVGDTEENIAKWSADGLIHLLCGVGGKGFTVRMCDSSAGHTNYVTVDSEFMFELSSEGVKINGVIIKHKDDIGTIDIIKTFTNIVIGSTQGNTRSDATYKYVYIMDV